MNEFVTDELEVDELLANELKTDEFLADELISEWGEPSQFLR